MHSSTLADLLVPITTNTTTGKKQPTMHTIGIATVPSLSSGSTTPESASSLESSPTQPNLARFSNEIPTLKQLLLLMKQNDNNNDDELDDVFCANRKFSAVPQLN